MVPEHPMVGYPLSDVPTRMARLADGLEVSSASLRSEQPVPYAGRFDHVQEAQVRPSPQGAGGPERWHTRRSALCGEEKEGVTMWDVLVVGARCAGAATALRFARAGHRVLVLEK